MKIPGKRIKGLSPDMACDAAAAQVVGLRLDAVRMMAPLAAHRWQDDVEHVHQLRVATRRAASAMSAFKPCLKKKQARKAKALLRTLRSAAGAARDADVHLALFQDLLEKTTGVEHEAVERAIESIIAERERIQPALTAAIEAIPDSKLAERFGKLVHSLEQPEAFETLRALASHTMSPLAETLRETASVQPWTTDQLHEIRIASKKLRYACEVFECCLDEATAHEFKHIFVPLLDALGELNDSDNMVMRLEAAAEEGGELAGLRHAPPAGVAALVSRFEADRQERQAQAIETLGAMLSSDFLDKLTGREADMARSA